MALVTQADVKKAYGTAPAALKAYIDSDELFDTFHHIRETHKLHIDQAGNLAMLIDAIVLDMHPLSNFPTLLKEALGQVDDATYQAVLREVNDKIFATFRDKLKAATTPPQKTEAPVSAPAANTTQLPPLPTPTAAPATKPISILESKLAATSAPTPVQQVVQPLAATPATPPVKPAAPTPPPATPIKYHGTDPYREPFQ